MVFWIFKLSPSCSIQHLKIFFILSILFHLFLPSLHACQFESGQKTRAVWLCHLFTEISNLCFDVHLSQIFCLLFFNCFLILFSLGNLPNPLLSPAAVDRFTPHTFSLRIFSVSSPVESTLFPFSPYQDIHSKPLWVSKLWIWLLSRGNTWKCSQYLQLNNALFFDISADALILWMLIIHAKLK